MGVVNEDGDEVRLPADSGPTAKLDALYDRLRKFADEDGQTIGEKFDLSWSSSALEGLARGVADAFGPDASAELFVRVRADGDLIRAAAQVLQPTVLTASAALVGSGTVTATASVVPGPRDWRSDWWLALAVTIFVQWMILRVAAEAEFEDTGLMDSLESSISTALGLAMFFYALGRRGSDRGPSVTRSYQRAVH